MWLGGALQKSGWHRNGNIIRSFYKHVSLLPGGTKGYAHVVVTVMGDTPEVHFDINLHNGGIEERRTGYRVSPKDLGEMDSNLSQPAAPYGQFLGEDVVFTRIELVLGDIPPAEGFAGAWTWTPALPDPVHDVAHNAFVKMIQATDVNRQHVLPITFERPFRFAVHPSSVTPYLKLVYGMQKQPRFLLQRASLPQLSALPAIDLAAEAATCKAALTALGPWQAEGESASGMQPANFLWPGSYSSYGGTTGGIGMWYWGGTKWLCTAQRAGYEILITEQLRVRARTHGALYYNISGLPVNPLNHTVAGVAQWRRFNRTFEKQGGFVKDAPFYVTSRPRKMVQADYNPGPRTGTQGLVLMTINGVLQTVHLDSLTDATPNVPDWWATQVAGDTITPLPFQFTLAHTTAPPPSTGIIEGRPVTFLDVAVPALIQIQGAGAFNAGKSISFRITGTGELDDAVVETVVFTGVSSPPPVQARQSVASFKTISKIEVTSITGTLLSTELISVGRAAVGIADYNGGDGITPMDDQHFVRMHYLNKMLFLGANDCLSKIYLFMDAASAYMTQWPGGGAAHRLDILHHGAKGRGASISRELATAIDMICTAYAIGCAHFGAEASFAAYGDWLFKVKTLYKNSVMTNGLIQAYAAKEGKQTPYGSANGGEGNGVFWIASGREAAYFAHAGCMLNSIKAPLDQAFQDLVSEFARAFKDMLWHVADGIKAGVHVYIPVALHRNAAGQVLRPGIDNIDANGTWEIYATQADLPAANPVSGCLINPPVYPPVDDDLYVASIAGNDATLGAGAVDGAMSALTLLRNDTDSGGAGLLPTPVEIKVTHSGASLIFFTGATWAEATKRITKTGAFTGYTFAAGDTVTITGGTGATPGVYEIASKVSNDAISLVTSIGAGADAQTDIGGNISLYFSNAHRRWLKITGTDPFGAALVENLLLMGNGAATQTFRGVKHFKTVTEIIMLTQAQATALGTPNLTAISSHVLFRVGTPKVGLQYDNSNSAMPTFQEGYQVGYALGELYDLAGRIYLPNHFGNQSIECAERFTSTIGGGVEGITGALDGWGEYSGGPAARMEQWLVLYGAMLQDRDPGDEVEE